VRGILSGDTPAEFVVDESGRKVTAGPSGASDAALLTPYHVDRSKLFALERLANSPIVDAKRVMRAIEVTRFPRRPGIDTGDNSIEPRLVQDADLSGQLGDPNTLAKPTRYIMSSKRSA
jgi:hypothetical protein